jgi:NAD(P)-dependent dehydrogenase (short-subunit alcohol dehydrogenase family)
MFRLDGKTSVVVGAASGIGAAIAEAYAGQGAVVACLDIDTDGAERTAGAIRSAGGTASSGRVDVRESLSVDAAFGEVVDRYGGIDIVAATPGVNVRKPLVTYTDDDYDTVVDVNLRGAFNVLRAAGRLMLPRRSGAVVVISSISCRVVEPGQVLYAGTKAALAQMVRVAAAELGPHGIRVNAISPGPVETPLTAPIRAERDWYDAYAARIGVGRWARPEEMAAPAVFLVSDEASYVNGETLFADGGWTDLDQRFHSGTDITTMAGSR